MDDQHQSRSNWWSQYWPIADGMAILLLVIAASAGINIFGFLLYLLPGACILMHLFMHRGHGHSSEDHHQPSDR